jgi:protein-S-isoprenylcysteine O-methyltransferase Ste14
MGRDNSEVPSAFVATNRAASQRSLYNHADRCVPLPPGIRLGMKRSPNIPRWAALTLAPLVWLVVIPLGHGVVPWAVSLLGRRYGSHEGGPAYGNLLGLVPVVAGTVVLLWLMLLGFAEAGKIPTRVELDWSPKIVLERGPYAVSRHPMYLAELALWFWLDHSVWQSDCAGWIHNAMHCRAPFGSQRRTRPGGSVWQPVPRIQEPCTPLAADSLTGSLVITATCFNTGLANRQV